MNIELRRIRLSEHINPGAYPFTAEVYVNDKFIGMAFSKGTGNITSVDFKDHSAKMLYQDADSWLKSEAVKNADAMQLRGDGIFIQQKFEEIISAHVAGLESRKFWELANKNMEHGLLYGVPENHYANISFRNPIRYYMSNEGLIQFFKELAIAHVTRSFQPECLILNNNIDHFIKAEIIERSKEQAMTNRLAFAVPRNIGYNPHAQSNHQRGL